MSNLYATVTGTTNIMGISISSSHNSPCTLATIEAKNTTLTLGDSVSIDLGYSDNHQVVFNGYVKQITRNVQADVYSITANDVMIRAQDYFIASGSSDTALSYQNIAAETLVGNLFTLAGLTNQDLQATAFTFGIRDSFEVNLVSVADYIRTIADLLTWHFWADKDGQVHFRNRKPYYITQDMVDEYQQYGLVADGTPSVTIDDGDILDISYNTDDRNLRNRVVVYGTGSAHGEASATSEHLPVGFYKTAMLGASGLLDTDEICQQVAEYNLNIFNRLTEKISVTIVGNPALEARDVISVDSTAVSQTGDWYIHTLSHTFSSGGFQTQMELTK